MENFRRLALYFALALVGVALWNAWIHDYPKHKADATEAAATTTKPASSSQGYIPKTFNPAQPHAKVDTSAKSTTTKEVGGQLITVNTDLLQIKINTQGGNLVSASLLKYPVSLKDKTQKVQILDNDPTKMYVAQNGLTNTGKPVSFTSSKTTYQLNDGENELQVQLTGKSANGLMVTKTYIFKRNQYRIDVTNTVKNASGKAWSGSWFNQLVRRDVPVKKSFHSHAYNGAAVSSKAKPYQKLSFKTMNEVNLNRSTEGGWAAMQQQYFLSVWVPSQDKTHHYYSHVAPPSDGNSKHKVYTVGYVSPQMDLAPGASATQQSTFYVGPEVAKRLKTVAKGLDLTINYGWLWPISKLIFWVMSWIHKVVGNWGWSIVLVTLFIKVMFYWFSDKSYRSMAKMRDVAPRMKALKERHGDDKQALSKATMEFYKKEGVNPMGGCLPMLVQIPVFIALYYVLVSSVELRQAPFIFWIHDLSVKDPYYVLPVLMGLSMLLQQKLSPPPPDPTQAKMMMLLPVVFTIFFITFPAGLVLYWLTNNVLSVAQQWYVMKTYDAKAEAAKKKRKKKK